MDEQASWIVRCISWEELQWPDSCIFLKKSTKITNFRYWLFVTTKMSAWLHMFPSPNSYTHTHTHTHTYRLLPYPLEQFSQSSWKALPVLKFSLKESESESCLVTSSPWNSPGRNTGVGSLTLLQRSSWPRNWTGVSCIAVGFFNNWAIKELRPQIKLKLTAIILSIFL